MREAIGTVFFTVSGNLWIALATPPLAIVTLIAALFGGNRAALAVGRFWTSLWLFFAGTRLRVQVAPSVDPGSTCVYMVNHLSMLDIPVLLTSLPSPAVFLAKKSLFGIPVFGWALRAAGIVGVDRKNRSEARSTFAKAIRRMSEGLSLLVFPEGTRSPDGRLRAFKRGGFLLAIKSGRAIVPVGLKGTDRLNPKGSLLYRPGPVEVRYGEPIEVAAYGVKGLEDLVATVRGRIADLAGAELVAERSDDAAGA
ncbi:MAG: lysophospholipid acyltransferase family protein [Thermoanaerobaculia bacterium]|nr:lysophospholipid acyltransferase family protein [Thermoanaerobaculia bacterium]